MTGEAGADLGGVGDKVVAQAEGIGLAGCPLLRCALRRGGYR